MRRFSTLVLAVVLALGLGAVPAGAHSPDAVRSAKGKPVALFFGDSYFVGGGCSPDRKKDMAYLAGTSLGYRTIVRGAGGTGFVAANPDYDLPAYLTQIAQGALDVRNPALVVIQGGSNDVGYPPAQIKHNAIKILRIARQKYPQAILALVGPMDTYGGYDDSIPVRAALKSAAKKRHVAFIDAMRWTEGHDDWLCDDYVHPTYDGHVQIAKLLAAALADHGA